MSTVYYEGWTCAGCGTDATNRKPVVYADDSTGDVLCATCLFNRFENNALTIAEHNTECEGGCGADAAYCSTCALDQCGRPHGCANCSSDTSNWCDECREDGDPCSECGDHAEYHLCDKHMEEEIEVMRREEPVEAAAASPFEVEWNG